MNTSITFRATAFVIAVLVAALQLQAVDATARHYAAAKSVPVVHLDRVTVVASRL
jgi:hypothetical protein